MSRNLDYELGSLSRNLDKNAFIKGKASNNLELSLTKKTFPIVLIFGLLFSTVAGAMFTNLGMANPYLYLGDVPPDADTKPPTVTILSPENKTYNVNNVFLTFNVNIGESSTGSNLYILNVGYEADRQQNITYVDLTNMDIFRNLKELTFNLTDIPEGKHVITVSTVERGSYIPARNSSQPMSRNGFSINGSSSVLFTIDTTAPSILSLSVENKTYYTSEVPLNVIVNEPVSQITYSLDGQENVTVAGNTTLTELPEGEHNVTVYATDSAGNSGTYETVYFSVKVPEPFPTTLVAATSTVTAAVASVALLVYFKKRKH